LRVNRRKEQADWSHARERSNGQVTAISGVRPGGNFYCGESLLQLSAWAREAGRLRQRRADVVENGVDCVGYIADATDANERD
jgi:hypothetical protein